MPIAPPNAVSLRWQPVAETLAEFREQCQGFEHEVSQLLDQFEQLQAVVERKDQELSAAWEEVFAARGELAEARREMERMRSEAHAEARKIREELFADLASRRAEPVEPIVFTSDEQFAEIERERAALEMELELVRGRAAELYNVVAEQKRDMAKQRDEMAAELRDLRKLLERQPILAEVPAASITTPPPVAARPAAKTAPDHDADPVVSSVMAQFAKLQQDAAQRRKQKK